MQRRGILRRMIRRVAFVAVAALAIATVVAVVRGPKLQCQSLEPDRCVAAANAIMAQARPGPSIVAIGLLGYRGCFGYCPLSTGTASSLQAFAGVEYEDGTKVALDVADLDPGGRPDVVRMGNLVDYIVGLIPER